MSDNEELEFPNSEDTEDIEEIVFGDGFLTIDGGTVCERM